MGKEAILDFSALIEELKAQLPHDWQNEYQSLSLGANSSKVGFNQPGLQEARLESEHLPQMIGSRPRIQI